MTREEATTKLKWFLESNLIEDISGCEGLEEAIGMAIEALSNTSNTLNALDCISRTMALTEIRHLYPSAPRIDFRNSLVRWSEKNKQYIECEEVIKRLPTAQIKPQWIPIRMRPMDAEEREYWEDHFGYELADEDAVLFDCKMPDDGQEILVSYRKWICMDKCEIDCGCYGLEGNGDWDGVVAWMPSPESYSGE